MVSDFRVGVLGAGYIASAHVGAYAATPGVKVVAVADPRSGKADRLAARVGAHALNDAGQLFACDLDAVSICTPSPTHAGLAVTALDAGLHVLCEKPIARTLDDASRMTEASRTSTGVFMVGHVSRFEPDHARAKQLVASGQLGELHLLKQSITSAKPTWSEGGWLDDPEQSGGPVVDLAIHSFDFLSWIIGSRPVRVTANAVDTDAGPATYALVALRYANGAIGHVETSWAHQPTHGFAVSTEIAGSAGRLTWDYDGLQTGAINSIRGTVRLDPLGDRGFLAEIAAFVDAARNGGPAPVSATDGLDALATSLAALQSIHTGQPVELAEGADGGG